MTDSQAARAEETVNLQLPSKTSPVHRILVADDDVDVRQFNAQMLLRYGYQVDAVEDGAVAWETLQLNNYDLLITDNDMPKVTGVDLLKKLRAARMALPVIMATGKPPDEEFIRDPGLQPAATLLKPYTLDELLGTVGKILQAASRTSGPGASSADRLPA